MGIFDGLMILSDLDGTLLQDGELCKQHLDAVRYFVENGGVFCPATGRPESFLLKSFPSLLLKSYCIVKNGTAIYDCIAKKYIWQKALDQNVMERVFHLLERFPTVEAISLHTVDDYISFRGIDATAKHKLRSVEGEILKIVFWMPNACDMVNYCEQFDDYQYLCSSDHLFEILAKETGKGVCTKILRNLLKDMKCFIGVGDYENDITLLEASDIAVAVDGGFEPLKVYADWVAPPIEEHPIAWLVNKIEMEIKSGRIL